MEIILARKLFIILRNPYKTFNYIIYRRNTLFSENGLPAGQFEVELIERLRKKREWDKYLLQADLGSEEYYYKAKVMTEIDADDWDFREKVIYFFLIRIKFKLKYDLKKTHFSGN